MAEKRIPDLSDLPEAPESPDRDAVDPWDRDAMDANLEALDRVAAYGSALLAGVYQAQGRPHLDVMLCLAGAETKAPAADRPFHAARLDAYAAAYGLRGWYRTTNSRGRHAVQVNRLRTTQDGEVGRYFIHHASDYQFSDDGAYWVVDRDSGRTAFRAHSAREAEQWIANAEA